MLKADRGFLSRANLHVDSAPTKRAINILFVKKNDNLNGASGFITS
jgi:hypothetical protein